MSKILYSSVFILIISMLIGVMPTEADGAIYEDTVRLHILANSDIKEDQDLKLAVRDAILKEHGQKLSVLGNAKEAEAALEGMLDEIKQTATKVIKEHGYDYPVRVIIGKEHYETRVYEEFTLPKGVYTSLRVEIGDAEGKNWWCVMYPPLCLGASIDDSGYTSEEKRLIGGEIKVKFKVLELLSEVFS